MKKVLGILFSYRMIAVVCAIAAFATLPFMQGTNPQEEDCVYTRADKQGTYVRIENNYELYDPGKHDEESPTYIKTIEGEYFLNEPNWHHGKPCRLKARAIGIFIAGYIFAFLLSFSFLCILRLSVGDSWLAAFFITVQKKASVRNEQKMAFSIFNAERGPFYAAELRASKSEAQNI